MTFLTWLVRLVIAAVVMRLVMGLFSPQRSSRSGRARSKPVERAGGTLVRDPQCGTYVPSSRALVVGRGADAKYFCSVDCRDAYLSSHGQRHAS